MSVSCSLSQLAPTPPAQRGVFVSSSKLKPLLGTNSPATLFPCYYMNIFVNCFLLLLRVARGKPQSRHTESMYKMREPLIRKAKKPTQVLLAAMERCEVEQKKCVQLPIPTLYDYLSSLLSTEWAWAYSPSALASVHTTSESSSSPFCVSCCTHESFMK